jgi:hypothetical protein
MRLAGTKLAANHQYRGFGDQLYDLSGQRPSLDLNFANSKSLVDATTAQNLVTFTRASSGTYVGSDGLIKTATTDTPRFDHNPTTNESLGLLVEEARTNLTQKSQEFADVYWTKTVCTITANESTAPDGTLTANLWTNTSSPGSIANSITKDTTSRTYTASVWVKGTLSQFTFSIDSGVTTDRGRVQFNLSTNTVSGTFNEGAFTNTSGTLTVYPNGWVRLTVTTTTSTGTTIRFRPFFSGSSASVRIWGAQIEEGAFATSYIPTTTATVTRSADVASITGSNFSSWYRQDEGTVFADGQFVGGTASSFPRMATLTSANTNNDGIAVAWTANTSILRGGITSGGVTTADLPAGPDKFAGSKFRCIIAASSLSAQFASDGTLATEDTLITLPTCTQLLIAQPARFQPVANTTIRRLVYWPQRLPNSTLQEITR